MHCEHKTGYNLQTASQGSIKGAEDQGSKEKMQTTTLAVLTFFTSLCAYALVLMLVMVFFRAKRNNDRNIELPDEVDETPRNAPGSAKYAHDLNSHTDEDWTTKTDNETHFSIDGVEMEDIKDESKIA